MITPWESGLAACRAVLFASLVDDPESVRMYREHTEGAAAKREELVKGENSNTPAVPLVSTQVISGANSSIIGNYERITIT